MTPDGHIELVLHFGSSELPVLCTPQDTLRAVRSYIIGLTTGPTTMDLPHQGTAVGIRFKPFGAAPFIRSSVHELTNRVTPLDQAWGARAHLFEDAIERALSKGLQPFDVLDRLLGGVVSRVEQDVSDTVTRSLPLIASNPNIQMKTLAKSIEISTRQLERIFKSNVGIPPKLYSKLQRLQAAQSMLSSGQEDSLTQVALACGFYDQPHFCREFKRFSGVSPSNYRPDNSTLH